MEDRIQNLEQVLNKGIKVMCQQENKLLDYKQRGRQENLRIYNVLERTEETSMMNFVEKLLWDKLEIPESVQLDIKKAHWAVAPKHAEDMDGKPRSIIIKSLR